MSAAKYDVTNISIQNGRGVFQLKGRIVIFDGWTRLSGISKDKEKDKEGLGEEDEENLSSILPPMEKGDELTLITMKHSQHYTKPPSRYTEAALIRSLEKKNIGRPSTYAAIMENIKRRGYIKEVKRMFHAEPLGEALVDLLMKHFSSSWMDYTFTAKMENELDEVAQGKMNWNHCVISFYQEIETALSRIFPTRAKTSAIFKPKLCEEKCPLCQKALFIHENSSIVYCSQFPKCFYIKQETQEIRDFPNVLCEGCQQPMGVKVGASGPFLGCSAYPKCRKTKSIQAIFESAFVKDENKRQGASQ